MSQQNWKNIKKLALGIVAFEGTEHLYNIITELQDLVDYVSIGLQDISYHGDPLPLIDKHEIDRLVNDGLVNTVINVKLDNTKLARAQETDKRNMIIDDAAAHGCTHIIVIDSDEYYTRASFLRGLKEIDEHDYEQTYCQYINYYHDYSHVLIYPFKDGMYVPFVTKTKYHYGFESTDFNKPSDPTRRYLRPYDSSKMVKGRDGKEHEIKHFTVDYHVFKWEEVKMHHLSWIRADIRKKLNMWSSKKLFKNYYDLIDKAVSTFNCFDPASPKAEAVMLFNTPENKVDVKALPRQYIHPAADINTRLIPVKDPKKLLFINMSSTQGESNLYIELDKACRETWAKPILEGKFPNCDFWTIIDTDKATYVDKQTHTIYIQSLTDRDNISQLLHRFIEGMKILNTLGVEYDYVLRANTSAWINVDVLNSFFSDETNDSILYTFKLYAAYWSCFNLYASGVCMIFSKRNMEILNAAYDKVKDLLNVYDDVVMSSIFYGRTLNLSLPQEDYIQSLNGENLLKEYDKTDFTAVDYNVPIYQVKTYDVSGTQRVYDDIEKMKRLQKDWEEYRKTTDVDDIASELRKNKSNIVWIIPYTKTEWLETISDDERHNCQFRYPHKLKDGLKYLAELKIKGGYK